MKSFLLVLVLSGGVTSAAEPVPKKLPPPGQLIVTQFVSAPFPHASRAAGRTYKEEFFSAPKHYSDHTVALFVPKGFAPGGPANFVVHFHGWRNTATGALEQFQLTEQFTASRRNAILIVPTGPHNAPDSGGGKLEDPQGFHNFMLEALATLQQRAVLPPDARLGQIILSGHSGGYQVMSAIVARGGLTHQIQEVWLFDGLYAQSEKFLAWAELPGKRLLNIYTDHGGTKARTEEMMGWLKQQGKSFLATTDQAVTAQELATNHYIFLHTDLGHNEVLAKRKTFQQFLESSGLPVRLEK